MLIRRMLAVWLLVVALVCTCPVSAWAGAADKQLEIYWVDVEGGAATLIVTPAGESVLIDSGNPGRRDAHRIFITAAEKAGLKQIDHLITTHYHVDHFGGAELLASFIPIKNVYDNGEFEGLREKPDPSYRNFPCEKRHVLTPGDKLTLKQTEGAAPLELRCLAARQKFIAGDAAPANADEGCAAFRPKDRDNSDNANSIVMILEFGGFRFFDAGDLTWNMEQQLVCPKNLVGGVDVYQVTHHGLDVSNNPAVIRSLAPTVAVMNNGVTKGCQPETFKTLSATKSIQAIYQMHKNLRADREHNAPDEFIANLEEKCMGESLKLSVTPDGKNYTLETRGNKRTYATRPK